MNKAKFIIARGGYTTIMELVELGKKNVLFIPSPGQTEQEYICKHLEKEGYFYSISQNKINLMEDIKKSRNFKGFEPPWRTNKSVDNFIKIIRK